MGGSGKRRGRRATRNNPLAWVMNMNPNDPGRPLRFPQTVKDAIRVIREDPTISLALPRIPGKADLDIDYDADISAIGEQKGMIFVESATVSDGALGIALLVREKLSALDRANDKVPGLRARIFGVSERRCRYISGRIRWIRNKLAHPRPNQPIGETPDLSMIPDDCKKFVEILLNWDSSPYRDSRETPSDDLKDE
jgi:hypothetical protein